GAPARYLGWTVDVNSKVASAVGTGSGDVAAILVSEEGVTRNRLMVSPVRATKVRTPSADISQFPNVPGPNGMKWTEDGLPSTTSTAVSRSSPPWGRRAPIHSRC